MILGAILEGMVQGLFGSSKRSSGSRRRSYGTSRRSYVPKGKSYRVYTRGR